MKSSPLLSRSAQNQDEKDSGRKMDVEYGENKTGGKTLVSAI